MNKAIKLLSLGFLMVLFMSFNRIPSPIITENKVLGTYSGVNDDGYFIFKLNKGGSMLFHTMEEDLEVDLYDEANEGGNFEVTWVHVDIDEYDDDGEPTGETFKGRKITHLKEM